MCCVLCVVCDALCVMCGVWCAVCGVQCVVCGVRCVVCGCWRRDLNMFAREELSLRVMEDETVKEWAVSTQPS